MKAKQALFITLVLVMVSSALQVDAAALFASAAGYPWTKAALKADQANIKNLSSAFVGEYEIPMLSYARTGFGTIWQAHLATSAVPGDCGPGNSWKCSTWSDPDLVPATLSNMAAMPVIDTHIIKWVYAAEGYIRGWSLELMNDMSYVTSQTTNLIQISKFGVSVVGAPSLVQTGGKYRLAVTILDSGDLFPHKLVYMYFTGSSNTSCTNAGSTYQCDVIDSSYGGGSIGAPSLGYAGDGTVGIAYYKLGDLMYAYPHTHSALYPSNCGPGGDTWRCISIVEGTPTGTLGPVVKLAMGHDYSERSIAYTYDDEMIPVTIYHAGYVGAGGNCGTDKNSVGMWVERWQCDDIVFFYYLNPSLQPSFSIALDPLGYPTIAYDYAASDMGFIDLYVVYPNARLGLPGDSWTAQEIDGVLVDTVDTGALAALAINNEGLGLIGYLQEEDYLTPDLKVAWQQFQVYLPVIKR